MATPIPDYPRRIQRHHMHPSSRNYDNDGILSKLNAVISDPVGSTGQVCNSNDSLFLGWGDGVAAVYSYQQPIFIYYEEHDVALMDHQGYSTTTSRHQSSCFGGVSPRLGVEWVVLSDVPAASGGDFSISTVDDLMHHLEAQYSQAWTDCAKARLVDTRAYFAQRANGGKKYMGTLSRLVDGKVPVPDLPAPESFFTKKKYTDLLSEYLVNGTVPPWQITETL